jgi:hypothetical protein
LNRTRETGSPRNGRNDDDDAAPSVAEALERARHHARAATGEALEAARALLDAAALLTGGEPADQHRLLALLAQGLEALTARLASGVGAATPELVRALTDALDAEIARWEARADDDAEARAVLRAFLGLRELLWELGVRPTRGARSRGAASVQRRRVVERVPVQG